MSGVYTRLQIILHWAVVALVLVQFLTHEVMEHAFEALERGGAIDYGQPAVLAHIISGVGILALMALRGVMLFRHGWHPLPAAQPLFQLAARLTHGLFYLLLVLLPLSGLAALGINPEVGEVHGALWTAFLVLLALHLAAVLFHSLARGEHVIRRMLVPRQL